MGIPISPTTASTGLRLPHDARMRIDHLVRDLGGLAPTSALLARGATARRIAAARACGEVLRPRRGVYCLPEVSERVQHAAAHGGSLACGAALAEAGAWIRDEPPTCVLLLDQGHETPHAGCADRPNFHRRASAPRLGVDAPTSALRSYLRCAPDDEARLCAIESCRALGLIADVELADLKVSSSAQHRALIQWSRSNAGSGLETIVRRRLSLAGVECRSQASIPGVGAVDLLVGDCLVIELDGREHHSDPASYHRDRIRDARTAQLGGATLRFGTRQVLGDPDDVVRTVRAAMGRGAHRAHSLLRGDGATPGN